MKDWQFWTFIAFFWLAGGILAPFPLDIFFFIGAFALGIFVHFIQARELRNERSKFEIQKILILKFIADIEEIKELLGKKRTNKQKEVKHGNKQKRV